MTTYNTGNPIGSTDPRDLFDNAENLDIAVNDAALTWIDRLGVTRKSFSGFEADFQSFLIASGYQDLGDYAAGIDVTARNQVFNRLGNLYRAGPDLVLPYTTTGDWGVEGPSFVLVGTTSPILTTDSYGTPDLAALDAFTTGKALLLTPGESAKLVCNPTTGSDIQAMAQWLTQCFVPDGASLHIELADGVHTVSTYIDAYGTDNHKVDIRGSVGPDFIQIISVAYTTVSAPIYQAEVVVATALPAGAVVGGPIGMQNMQGTIDVTSAGGAQIIKSIAANRLSFTFDLYSPVGSPGNGLLDNTLTDGLVANNVVVFKGSLICLNTGWDGGAREGFMNALDGGRIELRNLGLAYSGAAGTEHDMLFARGSGSRVYLFDRVGVAGAGDKVLRSYGGAEFFCNRSYIGGAAKAQELFQGVAGGFNQFVRTSCGGALTAGFTCGHASAVNFAQGKIGACGIAFRTTTLGASIAAFPVTINKCSTAILATQGLVAGTTATLIERCTQGMDWAAGGVIVGNFVLGAGAQANTSNSVRPGNTDYNGGAWYQNTALSLERENLTIRSSVPFIDFVDGSSTCRVDGDGGNLTLKTTSTSRDIFFKTATSDIGQIDGTDGHHYSQAMRLGVNIISTTRPFWTVVTGTPEGVVTAPVGSMVTRTDGGASTTLYVKQSGTGNTGWVAK